MKKDDIIKRIKNSALSEMPDVLNRINISNIKIDEPELSKSPFNFRRAFSYTFASIFILITGFAIFNFGIAPNITDNTPLENETEVVGFQIVSAATLFDSSAPVELAYTTTSNYNIIELSDDNPIVDNLDYINRYIRLAETVLGNQNSLIYDKVDSTNPSYEHAFEYRSADLLDNLIVYEGFYNQTESEGHTITNGIILHDDIEYQFNSFVHEVNGLTINKYRIQIDQENYIEVTNKSNNNIQKFSYKVFIDGQLDNESELTLTQRQNIFRAEIKINNQNEEMTLNVTRDSQSEIKQFNIAYKFVNQDVEGEMTVNLYQNQISNSYQYQYNFGGSEPIYHDRSIQAGNKAVEDDFRPKPGQTVNNQSQDETTSTEDQPGNQPDNITNGNRTNSSNLDIQINSI
ncbi:MAG: hypothetical protein KAU02_05410 [Tenericutes bacterium]|nr:hypothetical protein [Mycoplasmatota bacterium]